MLRLQQNQTSPDWIHFRTQCIILIPLLTHDKIWEFWFKVKQSLNLLNLKCQNLHYFPAAVCAVSTGSYLNVTKKAHQKTKQYVYYFIKSC